MYVVYNLQSTQVYPTMKEGCCMLVKMIAQIVAHVTILYHLTNQYLLDYSLFLSVYRLVG